MRRFHRSAHVVIWFTLAGLIPLIGLSAFAPREAPPDVPAAIRLSPAGGE